jgi:tetratricopeptide (TPR) repeat protein
LRNNPNSNLIRRNLMIAYGNYAALLGIPWSPNLGRPDEARVYSGKAVSIAREMVEADPNNITARHDLGMSLSRLGMVDTPPDGTITSLASLEEARSLIEPILVANTRSADTANQLALILEYEGHRQETLGRNDDAIASYRRSMAVMQPFLEQQNNSIVVQYITDEQNLALLYASMGRHADALEIATRSLARADKYGNAPPHNDTQMAVLAMGWSTLAKVQDRAGQMDKAAQSAEMAMKAWSSVKRPNVLTAYSRAIANMKNLLKIASGQ